MIKIRSLFTPPPGLTVQQWQLLGLVALAAMFGSYSQALLPLALTQIQAGLAIPANQVSTMSALIRLGALPAFLFALSADHWGRRRLLLLAIAASTLLTGVTAFSLTPAFFTLAQVGVRMFAAVATILANVMIIEEFPAHARGWGVGLYTALASVGGGCAALLFALIDLLPFGWRALYLVGLLALLLMGVWRTYLPETVRFQTHQAEQPRAKLWPALIEPLRQLLTTNVGRFATMSIVILLFNLGGDAALFYDPTYLQQQHGWHPWQIALLNLGAGFMALLGSALAGQVSDRTGRKRATIVFLVTMPLLIIAYYHSAGWRLPLFWAGLLFTSVGATVALSALSSELFPTVYRSTATGALAVVATLGGALSLLLHGFLWPVLGSPWSAVSGLALLILAAPLLILCLPETSGRPLEEIALEQPQKALD